MLKRQNVSKKLNNVTMYDMEGVGQIIGEATVSAGMSVPCGGFACPEEVPWYMKPAVTLGALVAAGIYYLKN